MNDPILSIITVNFNNKQGLIKTLESLKRQSFQKYEHIIIDAGSTDGSKETILEYSKENTKLSFWVSEKDNGIYDGMNKGIKHAKGEYLYFLNSGDYLIDGILNKIPFDGTQYIYGNIEFVPATGTSWIWKYPDIFDTFFITNEQSGWISQQACFIHHSLFNKHLYRTDYKIISDWIHAIQSIIFEGCSYKHLPMTIALYDGSGVSAVNQEQTLSERRKWIKENINNTFLNAFLQLEAYKKAEIDELIPLLNASPKFRNCTKKIIYKLFQFYHFWDLKHKKS